MALKAPPLPHCPQLVELVDGGQARVLVHQGHEDHPEVRPLGKVPVLVRQGEVLCRVDLLRFRNLPNGFD